MVLDVVVGVGDLVLPACCCVKCRCSSWVDFIVDFLALLPYFLLVKYGVLEDPNRDRGRPPYKDAARMHASSSGWNPTAADFAATPVRVL